MSFDVVWWSVLTRARAVGRTSTGMGLKGCVGGPKGLLKPSRGRGGLQDRGDSGWRRGREVECVVKVSSRR
jgi:hypothetical protein